MLLCPNFPTGEQNAPGRTAPPVGAGVVVVRVVGAGFGFLVVGSGFAATFVVARGAAPVVASPVVPVVASVPASVAASVVAGAVVVSVTGGAAVVTWVTAAAFFVPSPVSRLIANPPAQQTSAMAMTLSRIAWAPVTLRSSRPGSLCRGSRNDGGGVRSRIATPCAHTVTASMARSSDPP